MITAEKLNRLTSMTPKDLTLAIQLAGYKGDKFTGAEFVGLSTGSEFCYRVSYLEEGDECWTKVYVTYTDTTGRITAEY